MGLFDSFFAKKRTASASHILVKSDKGRDATEFLTELKSTLNNSKNIPVAFADAAAKYSACPSSKNGKIYSTYAKF